MILLLVNFLFLALLYFPKISLIKFSSSSVGIKPEDIIVLVTLFILILVYALKSLKIKNKDFKLLLFLCVIYVSYLIVVTLYYRGNFLYIGRYILYYSMLLFAFLSKKNQISSKNIENMVMYTLVFYFTAGVLQKMNLIGGFHTGSYINRVDDRITLIFTNSTEVGLVTGLLFGIVLGSDKNIFIKIFLLLITIAINILGQNRVAIVSMFVIIFIYFLNLKELPGIKLARVKNFFNGKKVIIIISMVFSVFIMTSVLKSLKRVRGESSSISFFKKLSLIKAFVQNNVDSNITPSDIKKYAVGNSPGGINIGDESLLFRLQKWTYCISVISSGYVFGIGSGNGIGDSMDGFYFRLLIESGVVGFLIYLTIFFQILRLVKNKNGYIDGIHYVFIILLIQGIFLDSFYFSRIGYLFWLLLAFKIASIQNSEEAI